VPSFVEAQPHTPHALVVDSYLTPAAGAETLLGVQHALASVEDRFLPLRIGQERRRPALALGILYRSAKFIALDMPQDHMLMVVAHEVFGHGARFREIGNGRIRYRFDAPIPYGEGGAVTHFNGEFPVSPLGLLVVETAGMEAQHVLANAIAERAIGRGRLHYREAWLYFESRLAAMSYVLGASDRSREGHDVADFLKTFKEACQAPCVPPRRREIQRRALVALADPLVYYSIYSFAAGYAGKGNVTSVVPMVPVGRGVRVLPSVAFQLTPHGTEWSTTLTGVRGEGRGVKITRAWLPAVTLPRMASVTVRVGDTGGSRPWGIGVRAADVASALGLRAAVALDLWRQPLVLADQTSAPLRTGASATATMVVPLPRRLRSQWMSGIHVTAGYKDDGFVPGEMLSRGLVLRVGAVVGP
jgi:hypothetical protein